jgi:hypothetical protein
MMDSAFDQPVLLSRCSRPVRTASEAASIVRHQLKGRLSIAGLNTLLMLERAAVGVEVEEARRAFLEWASRERLAA